MTSGSYCLLVQIGIVVQVSEFFSILPPVYCVWLSSEVVLWMRICAQYYVKDIKNMLVNSYHKSPVLCCFFNVVDWNKDIADIQQRDFSFSCPPYSLCSVITTQLLDKMRVERIYPRHFSTLLASFVDEGHVKVYDLKEKIKKF